MNSEEQESWVDCVYRIEQGRPAHYHTLQNMVIYPPTTANVPKYTQRPMPVLDSLKRQASSPRLGRNRV
jgi:hypothetical protein